MKDVTLRELLEAGCHFGHKAQKWHPKANSFIFQKKEGIHIIDLAKTKEGLVAAGNFVKNLAFEGKVLLVVATKRQAKGVVLELAKSAGAAFMTNRWVGGFITNWEAVKKNLDKINRMRKEKVDGSWQKFPKHEQVKLDKDLRKLELVYQGVAHLTDVPDALFIVDIKKENICLREATSKGITTLAIVDTNADPNLVNYAIPANDDAVGSIEFIVSYLTKSYAEGKNIAQKIQAEKEKKLNAAATKGNEEEIKAEHMEKKVEIEDLKKDMKPVKTEIKKVSIDEVEKKKTPVKEVMKSVNSSQTVKKEEKKETKEKPSKEVKSGKSGNKAVLKKNKTIPKK